MDGCLNPTLDIHTDLAKTCLSLASLVEQRGQISGEEIHLDYFEWACSRDVHQASVREFRP